MRKNGLLEITAAHRTVKDLDELLKGINLIRRSIGRRTVGIGHHGQLEPYV